MDPSPLSYVGIGVAWALVALFVTLVLRGKLVPRNLYTDRLRELDAERELNRELSEQNGILLRELGPTLHKFLADFRSAARKVRDEHDPAEEQP